jgi:isopenicillin N synthase-like dioxygenase
MTSIPEIDVGPLLRAGADDDHAEADGAAEEAESVGHEIDAACREAGFFYLTGHGVDPELLRGLDTLARQFFESPETDKARIAMTLAKRAWRGWFPLGAELTSGIPDAKEGIYFGEELGPDHPRVLAGTPMHGANLFPSQPEALRPVVLEYMEAMTRLAQVVLSGIAIGLGLSRSWFSDNLTTDPLVLFRIFRYPPLRTPTFEPGTWSVGEHTDYGLLTILGQDASGGLQVKTHGEWVDVPPKDGAFVCNLGDMLERLTGGRYRSTPHRVRNSAKDDRLSFPFFLDPSWDARVNRLPIVDRPADEESATRWDHMSVHGFEGTYGEYILSKVGKVFPDLAAREV